MNDSTADDLPGSRRSVRTAATRTNVYVMFALALLGGGLFLAGLLGGGGRATDAAVHALPESVVLMCVGMTAFALFFPWFLALYYARHLLICLERVEADQAALRDAVRSLGGRAAE